MKPIKKRLLLTIVLGGYLFFNVVLATHGFIILEQQVEHLNPDGLLINQIDKPRWQIGYRFGTICPEEFREREEELKAAIIEILRAWLKPLRDEFPGRAITDDFHFVLLEDFVSWEDEAEKERKAWEKKRKAWDEGEDIPREKQNLDVLITFGCENGQSFAFPGGRPHVFMKNHDEADTRQYIFILVHEIGHTFGQGDTYINKERISTGGSSWLAGKQPTSVMAFPSAAANHPHYLTEDDKKGILWLYRYYYEEQLVDDCFFSDYEFEEETGGCRPKYLVIYEVKNGIFQTVSWTLQDDPTLDINERDADGFTALYHAVLRGHEEIVETLLEQTDIKVNILSKDKRTPAQLARELGERELARMIEAHPTADLPPWSVTSKDKLTTTWGHLKKRY